MKPLDRDRLRPIPSGGRALAAVAALALLVPLGLAWRLEPDPRGHGTHRQLGLPPCTVVALFGVRCPTCGMTTAWSHVVRGRLWSGAQANLGGELLAFAAIGTLVGLLWIALRGRRPRWFPGVDSVAWMMVGVAVITLIDWTLRILWT